MSQNSLRIALGADHGGVELKDAILAHLKAAGHQLTDFGTQGTESVDYPDFANAASRAVSDFTHDVGILCCTSGVGVSIGFSPPEFALKSVQNLVNFSALSVNNFVGSGGFIVGPFIFLFCFGVRSLRPFHDHRDGFSAADAQRGDTVAPASLRQAIEQGHDHAGPACSDRVTQGHASTEGIHFLPWDR